ncbi:MAG: hypothetical protein PHE83_10905 [Opitutaceae bacterium]|nr:hypothetical protein [Opitutaceae bacterium]
MTIRVVPEARCELRDAGSDTPHHDAQFGLDRRSFNPPSKITPKLAF